VRGIGAAEDPHVLGAEPEAGHEALWFSHAVLEYEPPDTRDQHTPTGPVAAEVEPDEAQKSIIDAIQRRLDYELGMRGRDIQVVLPRGPG
jgi:isopentenyldiphosphate isomerase